MASRATASGNTPSHRWRAYFRLFLLAGWFVLCVTPHLITGLVTRSRWPRRFLGGVAWIAGADVRREGPEPRANELLIGNHVSWLDIPVMAGATGCAFISKAEIANHWFMKWIADQNHTVYVDRADRRGIHEQAGQLRDALHRDRPVAVFPEGTVGDGGQLLPFKPALLSAVAPPPEDVTLRPVAVDYNGFATNLAWAPGEGGVNNFLKVLGRKGRLPVTVRVLEPLPPLSDRKALARAAHDRIADALAPSGIVPAGL
jgi:1-acyl-sn-glycerol-3-phosphate acyltransferase